MTLGKTIKNHCEYYGYTKEEVAKEAGLSVEVIDALLLDAIYPNEIPIRLLQRALDFLSIPYDVARIGIMGTFDLMEAKKSRGEYKSEKRYAELWENKESIGKYSARLEELMNAC